MLLITVYYYQDGEDEVGIEIKSESILSHPLYWSYPVILSGSNGGVKVKITIKSNTPITSDDIDIIREDTKIRILDKKTYPGIIQIVNNYLDGAN